MSLNTINKNVLGFNILQNINNSLGIDNSLISSKTRLMADSLAEEINQYSLTTESIKRSLYTATAELSDLDKIGAEDNIYRNYYPYIAIDDNNICVISPKIPSDGFDDIIVGRLIINAGESFEIDGIYNITFLQPVVVASKFSDISASIKIEPIDSTDSVRINNSTRYELYSNNNPYLETVSLKVNADINYPLEQIDDDDFRILIQKTKALSSRSSQQSIVTMIGSIPSLNGFSVSGINTGTGNIIIYIVTKDMVNFGYDNQVQNISNFINGLVFSEIPGGSKVTVAYPYKLNLNIVYKNNSSPIPTNIIKDAIVDFVKESYKYSDVQIFDTTVMTSALHLYSKELSDISITAISMFDTILNEEVIGQRQYIQLDEKSYITISSEDITEE